eukprot:TRINITY_DN594_c0_g1_i1.p1 TRINITY_DN594_c0_g1~~TRINITY_DN594_c0_g1_i1.p1  ORF type:complete len:268 (+),score=52.38 TRINITY_DN594_c0_g1_i1:45-806(+)
MAYTHRVRIGNWQEDVAAEEDRLQTFLEAKKAGRTANQTFGAVLAAAAQQAQVSAVGDGFVNYGETALIRHCDTNAAVCSNPSPFTSDPSRLTATAAPDAAPTLRSTFQIESTEATQSGMPLCYNQSFYLKCQLPGGTVGYLTSERLAISSGAARYSGKQNVFVSETETPDFDSAWVAIPVQQSNRLELEYQPVPANEKVLIRHARTGLNLAVLKQHIHRHEFGSDFEIVAHTFLNSHKAEDTQNIFTFEEQS